MVEQLDLLNPVFVLLEIVDSQGNISRTFIAPPASQEL
jgi:hypothetical protein